MANPWLRLYSEFADDPKVQMMSEAMQRRLIMLFCSKCKGETLHETELAFHWRISETELAETKSIFLKKGFIDEAWNLMNWDKRQFISDSSTERVRKHRQAKKQCETLHETDGMQAETENVVTVTPPEQNRTEQIQNRADTETNTPLPPQGGEVETRRGLTSLKPNERMESIAAIVGPAAAATFRSASELVSPSQVREDDAFAYKNVVTDARRAAVETTLNSLLGVRAKPVEQAAGEPIAAGRIFLEELHDEFARAFSAPQSVAAKRDGFEDPLQAWQRCFEHARVASVEAAEGRDSDYVVILETPKPRDLADGLTKYKAKVSSAMKKSFGREVQLVARLEAA